MRKKIANAYFLLGFCVSKTEDPLCFFFLTFWLFGGAGVRFSTGKPDEVEESRLLN